MRQADIAQKKPSVTINFACGLQKCIADSEAALLMLTIICSCKAIHAEHAESTQHDAQLQNSPPSLLTSATLTGSDIQMFIN